MKTKTILILGGYGGAGRVVSRMLLKETDVDSIIAGRRINKAEELASQLIKEFPSKRVLARYADASEFDKLLASTNETKRITTEEEGAEAHCQLNNFGLQHQISYDFLDEVFGM